MLKLYKVDFFNSKHKKEYSTTQYAKNEEHCKKICYQMQALKKEEDKWYVKLTEVK